MQPNEERQNTDVLLVIHAGLRLCTRVIADGSQ